MSRLNEAAFTQKSLKLLADPCKLKDIHYNPKSNDALRSEIDYKFNHTLSDNLYSRITQDIQDLVIIDSVLQNLINRVNSDQNP